MIELSKLIITGKGHPHHGKSGTVAGVEKLGVLSRLACKVRLDAGGSCFVLNPLHLVVVRKDSRHAKAPPDIRRPATPEAPGER